MSLLKTNEIQNYNGSSLTLTASTVSTSAQLNTGGNISVTGSLNVSDDSTTRTNLGLGTISTQDSNNVNLTGGTIGSGVVFPAGHMITHSTFYNEIASVYYETTSNSYTDMGLEISITPKNSSSDSVIVVNFYAGLSQNEASDGVATINYSTSSGVTTESSSTQLITSSYQIYVGALHNSSVQMLHQNYSANTTQYYRIFLKSNSSGNNVRLIHQSSVFSFYAYEVKK
jgi:hypothetical protein